MSHYEFVDHKFHDKKPEHSSIPFTDYKTIDITDPKYSWKYYGHDKYGRYAVCENTNTRRGLTFGEFYGTGPVD